MVADEKIQSKTSVFFLVYRSHGLFQR